MKIEWASLDFRGHKLSRLAGVPLVSANQSLNGIIESDPETSRHTKNRAGTRPAHDSAFVLNARRAWSASFLGSVHFRTHANPGGVALLEQLYQRVLHPACGGGVQNDLLKHLHLEILTVDVLAGVPRLRSAESLP